MAALLDDLRALTLLEGKPTSAFDRAYSVVDQLGRGNSTVMSARERRGGGRLVAVKRMQQCRCARADAVRCLREVAALKAVQHSAYAVRLVRVHTDPYDVYLVMELMDTTLERVIHSRHALSARKVRHLTRQLLAGLRDVHAAGVIHRDIKPSNLLVSASCALQIADFGLARAAPRPGGAGAGAGADAARPPMTEYVVTRWYRPPELLLAAHLDYGCAVDVWSAGVVLAELLARRHLFNADAAAAPAAAAPDDAAPAAAAPERDAPAPGSLLGHVVNVAATLGVPPLAELEAALGVALPADAKRAVYAAAPPRPADALRPGWLAPAAVPPAAYDLLAAMLVWAPADRATAAQAAAHPFLHRSSGAAAGKAPPARAGAGADVAEALELEEALGMIDALADEWPT